MKRMITVVLAVSLVFALFGCTGDKKAKNPYAGKDVEDTGFSVGFGQVNITPMDYSVPIGGYGNTSRRMSQGFMNYMYTTCVAMTDKDGNTILLFNNDLLSTWTDLYPEMCKRISAATGVPAQNIMISATHTHSGPDLANTAHNTIIAYRENLSKWMAEAALQAMEDRKAAEIRIGTTTCPGLNFIRHYLLSDGSYIGSNFGDDTDKTYVGPATDIDNTMQLMRFVRKDAQDVLMINWQTHPTRVGGDTQMKPYLASDIVGVLRETCQEQLDCKVIYLLGAAGDVNCRGNMESETIPEDYMAHGQALAQYAIDAYDSLEKVETGKLEVVTSEWTGKIDHSEDDLITEARAVAALESAGASSKVIVEEASKYGINSAYHARGIISKYTQGESASQPLFAFRLGEIGFVVAPYEMFTDNGRYIKENSPFEMTFVVTCANGHYGYMPTAKAYDYHCYEANTCRYERGVGDALAEEYMKLLQQLHGEG